MIGVELDYMDLYLDSYIENKMTLCPSLIISMIIGRLEALMVLLLGKGFGLPMPLWISTSKVDNPNGFTWNNYPTYIYSDDR